MSSPCQRSVVRLQIESSALGFVTHKPFELHPGRLVAHERSGAPLADMISSDTLGKTTLVC
jgi:hypothetical protein